MYPVLCAADRAGSPARTLFRVRARIATEKGKTSVPGAKAHEK